MMLIFLVSVAKAESVEKVDSVQDTTMNLTEKLLANYKTLTDFWTDVENKNTLYRLRKFKLVKDRLDEHFVEIISLKDPKLDDVLLLAKSFTYIFRIMYLLPPTQENFYEMKYYHIRRLALLKDKELNSKTILMMTSTFNDLFEVYLGLGDEKSALLYVNKSLTSYLTYTKGEDKFPTPVDTLPVLPGFSVLNTNIALDAICLRALSAGIILSNCHASKNYELINMEKLSIYLHKILKKNWRSEFLSLSNTMWIFETLHLAEYFLSCDRLIECKNHLCAASTTLMRFYNENCMTTDPKISALQKDYLHSQFKSFKCIIQLTWVKYGLVILYLSKKQLPQKEQHNVCKANESKVNSTVQSNQTFTESLMFTLNEKELEEFSYISVDNYVTNYNDAKLLFLAVLKLLSDLKTFLPTFKFAYTNIYVDIAQYTSKAYKYFALYEHDKNKQIKLQKRRIEILENYLKTVSGKDKQNNCSFIWFELAIIYSTLLDIKIADLQENQITAEDLKEIEELVKNSRKYFQLYLNMSEQIQTDNNYHILSCFNLRYKTVLKCLLMNRFLFSSSKEIIE